MIYCFTSIESVGCTFMDWSFHWLSGHQHHWHYNDQEGKFEKKILPDNPVAGENAHGYHKNHPDTAQQFDRICEKWSISKFDLPLTVYPTTYPDYRQLDTKQCLDQHLKFIDHCLSKSQGVVFLHKTLLYPPTNTRNTPLTESSLRDRIMNLYPLNDSQKRQIETLWGLRQFASIWESSWSHRWCRQARAYLEPLLAQRLNCLNFTDEEWYWNPEHTIIRVMTEFNQDVVEERLQTWRPVMARWQQIFQQHKIWHEVTKPRLAQHIIEGSDHDLEPLGLDRQIDLMSHLMHQHGRRLMLEQDEWPHTVADLHRLLK